MKLKIKIGDKTYTTQPKNVEKEYERYGSKVIQAGRKILNQKKKRATGSLFDGFHYKYFEDAKRSSINLEFKFGNADTYWRFIDAGVQGSGGFSGSGKARGGNSPFKFTNKQPPLKPLLDWISLKGIMGRDDKGRFIKKESLAFVMARSIKQKGLPRTLFFTRAVELNERHFEKRLSNAWLKDMSTFWDMGLPKTIATIELGTITLD